MKHITMQRRGGFFGLFMLAMLCLLALVGCADAVDPIPAPAGPDPTGPILRDHCGETYFKGYPPPNQPGLPCK